MAILTDITLALVLPGWWRAAWGATAPGDEGGYYVYRRGELIAITDPGAAECDLILAFDDPEFPQIEVADDAADVPLQKTYAGRLTLAAWTPPDGVGAEVSYLRIDEEIPLDSDTWVAVAYSFENSAKYHTHLTDWLDEDSTHNYRLVPVYEDGRSGPAIERRALVVRHPTRRRLAHTYSAATGLVSIAEA